MNEQLKIGKADDIWDVVVVGGGPAGMMTAGFSATRGRKVMILEKNETLGKKLLITGGGRCNLTNNKVDTREMLLHYKGKSDFLFSAFSQFGVRDTLDFFHDHGMPTKEETGGRVFPVSNKSQSVLDVLIGIIREKSVKVMSNSPVTDVSIDKTTGLFNIKTRGATFIAHSCVIATGGTSRKETGSTGDGFVWLKKLGHTVIENNFALVPVALKDSWTKKLSGISLPEIKLTTYQNGEKQETNKGKLLFTHFGISGPAVLNMSKEIGELLKYGEVTIMLDLFPNLDPGALKNKFQTLLIEESNKKLKNVLGNIIPSAMTEPLLALIKINGDEFCHSIRHEDRIELVRFLKSIPLHAKGLLGADKAIVSSGGVPPSEVDFKTMQSKIVPNLYLVGDILDIDRPSGGYSLQLCWTTGFVASCSC